MDKWEEKGAPMKVAESISGYSFKKHPKPLASFFAGEDTQYDGHKLVVVMDDRGEYHIVPEQWLRSKVCECCGQVIEKKGV